MKLTLILMSFVLQLGGSIAAFASFFSTDEFLFVKAMLVVILGVQISQDKEIWE